MFESLARRVYGFTVDQEAAFLDRPRRRAAARMRSFYQSGLVEVKRLLLRPTPPISGPIAAWYPGDAIPLEGPISYRARRRWQSPAAAARWTTVYVATARTVSRFGGKKCPRIKDATHDLGVSQTFIHFWQERGDLWSQWVGEDHYDHELCAPKVPDAVLLDRDGAVRLMVDYCGAYRPDRVRELIDLAVARKIPLELY